MKNYSIKLLKMNRKHIRDKLVENKRFIGLAEKNAPQFVPKYKNQVKFYNKLLLDLNESIKLLEKK